MNTPLKDSNNLENRGAHSQAALLLSSRFEAPLVEKMTDVLSILSKDDALSIFILAKDGLLSEIGTPFKIGLTRKQYYTRLKQLVDLGLLSKSGEIYNHTSFGTVVFQKHIMTLAESIKKSKQLEMVDVLKQSSRFDSADIIGFLSKIADSGSGESLTNTPTIAWNPRPIHIASTFKEMETKIIEMVEFAQQEILLITRFKSERIINAMLKKANMGVNVRVVADPKMIESYIFEAGAKIQVQDKNSNERANVVSNPFYPSKVARRLAPVPFCLLIVDNKQVGIEIADLKESDKFKMTIFAVDRGLATKMAELFEGIWMKASGAISPTQIDPNTQHHAKA